MNTLIPRPRFWADAALQKRNQPPLFIELMIFFLVMLVASMIQSLLETPFMMGWFFSEKMEGWRALTDSLYAQGATANEVVDASMDYIFEAFAGEIPAWLFAVQLITCAANIVTAILFCKLIEKRGVATMGLGRKGWAGEYFLGLVIGLALFGIVYAIGVALGGFTLGDYVLRADQLPLLLLTALGFGLQGAGEELMLRGYLAPSLNKRVPAPMCVVFTSLLFAVLHVGNPGFTAAAFFNILLFGLVMCVYTVKRGSLWGACALHSMWNFAQGCIFGMNVSGLTGSPTLFAGEVVGYNELLTGGDFGPEGSLCCTVVLLAALGLLFLLPAKDPAPEEPAEASENPEER